MNLAKAITVFGVTLAPIASASAAGLPLVEPDGFAGICGDTGKGFFNIPGTDTCLRVSGLVRSDMRFEYDSGKTDANDFHTDLRGRFQADARTDTEWGTLRSVIEFEGRWDSSSADYNGDGAMAMRQGFVEFAGVTAGHLNRSFFDFTPYKHVSDFFSDERVNTIAYTEELADGVEATLGIEDKYFRANPNDGLDSELDQIWPNAIAAFTAKAGWGELKLSAALQDNEGDREIGRDGDAIGWAAQAGLVLNLPTEVKGSRIWAQSVFSSGASSYAGGEDFRANFVSGNFGSRTVRDQRDDGAGNLVNTDIWSAGGGLKWFWTKEVHSNLSAIYSHVDPAGGFAAFDHICAEVNTFWNPAANLEFGFAVQYGEAEIISPGDHAPDTDDHWAVVSRIGRSF